MPTSRQHINQGGEVSVLRSLRQLMPLRILSYSETLQRAEAQANRLLRLHGLTHGPIPNEVVIEQPRIRVERSYDLPTSGSAVWENGCWVITLNAGEPERRQRFSLLHEYKHIIDHPTSHLIRGDVGLSSAVVAEKVADYFAACVLMPKAWVKTAFFSESQSVERLAAQFQVSPKAMSVRLRQLGLVESGRRHLPTINLEGSRSRRWPTRYFRAFSTSTPQTTEELLCRN